MKTPKEKVIDAQADFNLAMLEYDRCEGSLGEKLRLHKALLRAARKYTRSYDAARKGKKR